MSRYHIERIIEFSKTVNRHGKWSEFCLKEGLTKDAVFHWRKKLGLPIKSTVEGLRGKRAGGRFLNPAPGS